MVDKEIKNNRKIIFWGAGGVARSCVEQFPDIAPLFIVDHKPDKKLVDGIDVFLPEDISDWKNYFIVVSTFAYTSVKNELDGYGLREGEDYAYFWEYFCYDRYLSSIESLDEIKKSVENGMIKQNRIMIWAPFYIGRRCRRIRNFITEYIKKTGDENYLIWNAQREVSTNGIRDEFECMSVRISIPSEDRSGERHFIASGDCFIDEDEKNFIKKLRDTKKTKAEYEEYLNDYIYYRSLFEIMKPSAFIMWSGWTKESMMIGYLTKRHGIDVVYGEYGWLEGTLQFDPGGIAGKSVLCSNKTVYEMNLQKQNIKDLRVLFEKEKKLIIEKDRDKKWNYNEYEKLDRLDISKKNILFVGMGDAGMDIDPKSAFWSRFVSSCVCSSVEAARFLSEICLENDWNLIYKPHPLELTDQKYILIEENEHVQQAFYTPIERLIEFCDVVVSITSAVDFKTFFYNKPLVQLGRNVLNISGCTYVAENKDEIETQLKNAVENGFTDRHWDAFILLMKVCLKTTHWDDMSHSGFDYGVDIFRRIV